MPETQKPGRPIDVKPDKWQRDLNPNPNAGLNAGMQGSLPEKSAANAYDLKDVHRYLEGFTDDELRQIRVLPPGSRLKQGATYVDLLDSECKEFTAMGGMEVGSDNWYVPKTETSYEIWNRLTGVQNPERLNQSNQ